MKNISPYLLKFKIRLLCALFFLGLTTLSMVAQNADVKQGIAVVGKVVDDTGEPLIGVVVKIQGTDKGTITDIEGNYTISVPGTKSVLRFSYMGFAAKEVVVGNQRKINIEMHEDLQQLDEVVVVGYGIQKKSHLTGSIAKVKTEGLEDIPSSRVDQALQGKIAGVQIQNITSEVGTAPIVRVRGMASISASSTPLIIVDGFPVEGGLEVVNMNDIESIEVLKDAASAAIYGSRAANGVIMVTTKSGGAIDKPKYSLRTSWGIKDAYKLHPIMSSKDYVAKIVEESNLLGTALPDAEFAFSTIDNDTDWQKEGIRTANIYNVQFGINGGQQDVKYYISGSYTSDEGIMLSNSYDKMNLRFKVDSRLSNRVNIGFNLAPTYTERERPATNYIDFYRTPSWLPVRHTEQTAALTKKVVGDYANGADFNNVTYTGIDPQTGEERSVLTSPFNTANHNPMMIIENEEILQKDYRLQGSGYVDVKILKNLIFKTSNGFDISYMDLDRYRNYGAKKDGETNRGLYQNKLRIDLVSENTLNYSLKIDKHDITAMLGVSGQKTTTKTVGLLGIDFPTDMVHTLNAAGKISQYEDGTMYTGTWKEDEVLISYFGRVNYSYEDRYLLSASLRADGSSKFGSENLWGWFPSISAGWRISEESFFKDNIKWVDQLKLRTSYGVTGSNSIPNYANINTINSSPYPGGSGSGTLYPGYANNSTALGNRWLKWEQTNEFNNGINLTIFKNRIGLDVDYYYSTTKSLLYNRPISPITGYLTQWTNDGKIRNSGLEIELTTYNVNNKLFTWTTSFNFSTNSNKVLDLGGAGKLINQGERNEMYITQVGQPSVQFYGLKTIGVWNSQEEIDNNPHHNSDEPGGLRTLDANGDGKVDDGDMVVIGDPFPDFTWGITNTFKYKAIDLSFLVQGVQGIDVMNGDEFYNESRKWNSAYVTNRWLSAEHPGDGKTPYFNNGIDHMLTDYPIQDGSYIALRDITIGYTIPKKKLKKTLFSKVRFYASAQNLGYWFVGDYKGINPEARTTSGVYSSPLVNGYQRGAFPLQRTFNFGIDVNF